MDAGRLLKTANDILEDEAEFSFGQHFEKIASAYGTDGQSNEIETERQVITEAIKNSRVFNYVRSDYEILDSLEVRLYFGEASLERLNAVLGNEAHTIKDALNKFVQERKVAIEKLTRVKQALDSVSIEPRELEDNRYQFGFTLPEEYRNFHDLEVVLKDVELLLQAIAHAKDEAADFKVAYVSSSDLQFYVDLSQALAANMAIVMDCALRVYGVYSGISELREKFNIFTGSRKNQVLAATEEQQEEMAKDFANDLINELGIEKPDDQNRVRVLFARFLKHMQRGVGAEVRTPPLAQPTEPKADDPQESKSEFKNLQKQYEAKTKIDTKNKEIYFLQINNFNGARLAFLETVAKEKVKEIKKITKKRSRKKKGQ